ncbi:MAG: hypothetical protein ISS49_05490 [Anaerolineae bacterium]|nr:hypothetical protein [Anaerolineae bacterium]
MFEKKMMSRILFITLISVCLLAVAAPVRGDPTGDPMIGQTGLVREQSPVISNQFPVIHKQWTVDSERSSPASPPVAARNTQHATRNAQLPISNPQSPILNPQSASRTVTYTYDDTGRLVLADYGDNRSIVFTYDDAGNLVSRAVVAPVTEEITPDAGGTLTYTDPQGNDTTVAVPPGAVSQPTNLTYTPFSAPGYPAPAMLSFAGHAFGLEAYLGGSAQQGFAFSKPVTITIHYSEADVVWLGEDALTLDFWDGGGWVDAATTCTPVSTYDRRPDGNWLAVPICHLSEFALFGEGKHYVYLPLVFKGVK